MPVEQEGVERLRLVSRLSLCVLVAVLVTAEGGPALLPLLLLLLFDGAAAVVAVVVACPCRTPRSRRRHRRRRSARTASAADWPRLSVATSSATRRAPGRSPPSAVDAISSAASDAASPTRSRDAQGDRVEAGTPEQVLHPSLSLYYSAPAVVRHCHSRKRKTEKREEGSG